MRFAGRSHPPVDNPHDSVCVAGVHQHPAVGEIPDFVLAVAELAQYLFVVFALTGRLPIGLADWESNQSFLMFSFPSFPNSTQN
jgi:hypothetical protein